MRCSIPRRKGFPGGAFDAIVILTPLDPLPHDQPFLSPPGALMKLTLGLSPLVALTAGLALAAVRSSVSLVTAAADLWLAVEAGVPEDEPRPSVARRAGHFALTVVALSLPGERERRHPPRG
jgi:hypothetical protein